MVDTAGRDTPRSDPREALVRVIASIALAAGGVYLLWRLLWTWQGSNPVMFVILFICELFGWLMLASFTFLAWRMPRRSRPSIGKHPTVGVFVCTYDEGLHVLEATLVGCDRITYPHVTYVLDDGRRPEVRELANLMGAVYITRPTNEHAKAGNINHALACTGGDLLLMLDADHVPQPDILDATVGYFDDERMALRTARPEHVLRGDNAGEGPTQRCLLVWVRSTHQPPGARGHRRHSHGHRG
jgi:cellulose synthase (UDP-forming)